MVNIKVAAALIKKDGKILLAKRAKGELAGFWEFPGGKIEGNETIFEAVIREIKEELGINIKPIKLFGTFNHKYDFADLELTLVESEIVDPKQKILLDGSHSEYTWFDVTKDKLKHTPLDEKIMLYLN